MANLKLTGRRAPALIVGLVAALLVAGSATADPATVAGKQAEAERVLAEIQAIDMSVGQAAEAFNAANLKLTQIRAEQKKNAALLKLSRANLGRAQRLLEQRVVALYTADGDGNALEILLGATSLEDLLNRLETVDRVSDQDQRVLGQVKSFRGLVQTQKSQLAKARKQQERVVADRAAQKRAIEVKLAQRQQLLGSIRGEISRLQAAERRRALAAAAATRRRIAASPRAYELETDDASVVVASAPAEPEAGSAPPARYGGVVGVAMQYLGVPYKWGGESPSGFDCSGLIVYAYRQIGVSLPHYTGALWGQGVAVSRGDLQPGDLVFFNGLGHAGIYVGGNSFIHAPHTGDVVKISSLGDSWYARTYMGARRIL